MALALNLIALILVVALCWVAMIGFGPRFHTAFGRDSEVPDDLSELLDDESLADEAPCDTCDGVGAGTVDGELITCPACFGTGIISST